MDDFPAVFLVSNPGVFPLTVAELLLANHWRVKVLTENTEGWKEMSGNLVDNRKFGILDIKSKEHLELKNVVYIDDGLFKKSNDILLEAFFKIIKTEGLFKEVKCHFYFNFNDKDEKSFDRLINTFQYAKTIYIKDLFGPGIIDKGISIPSDLLIDGVAAGGIILPKNDLLIKPLFIDLAAKEIVRQLVLFSDDKYETLVGEEISVKDFSFRIIKNAEGCNLVMGDYEVKNEREGKAKSLREENLDEKIKKTLEWYQIHLPKREARQIKGHNPSGISKKAKKTFGRFRDFIYRLDDGFRDLIKIFKRTIRAVIKPIKVVPSSLFGALKYAKIIIYKSGGDKFFKYFSSKKIKVIIKVFLLSIVITLLPAILLIASIALVLLSQEVMKTGNRGVANGILKTGTFTSNLSKNGFLFYSSVPGFGKEYLYMKNIAEDVDHVANIGTTLTNISITASNLSKKMLGEKDYSVSEYSKAINVEIDKLYRQASFLEGDIKKQDVWHFKETASLLKQFNLEDKRNKLFGAKKVVESLPIILSEKGEKNYLLLFQNNMELRPTGGFIGSFAIIKFKNGKLADLNVMDVYTADGQLKGHVEPPSPIKNYLNQANWYLRDSNWDPDFIVSAQRAEWFVSKEMDMTVDGVIAMDLNFIKDIVAATGPVKIKDYDRTVNKDNLYEIVQYEAEKDFFPGSQQKTSFLTALSKELILNFSQGKTKNLLGLANAFYNNLEEGHIQIFFHDNNAQKGIGDLGWSGKIDPPACEVANCYSDWLGVVEANLGVNKANYFVERTMNFSSYIDRRIAKRRVEINLKSTANPALNKRGTYGVYLRVMAPENAEFEDVRILSRGQEQIMKPDVEHIKNRTEAGVFIEVAPSTGTSVTFSWKNLIDLDFENKGKYLFYWKKQSGTDKDKVSVEVNLPKGLTINPSLDPSLTGTGTIGYNLTLSKNIGMFFDW